MPPNGERAPPNLPSSLERCVALVLRVIEGCEGKFASSFGDQPELLGKALLGRGGRGGEGPDMKMR